jgi:hypothetical protein
MRRELDQARVRALLEALGLAASGPGRVYVTGGTSAVLEGWRQATVDADLKLDPEPPGIFEALRRIKDELELNVELASPDDFLPPLPGWRERSLFISRHGEVEFYHYDFYAQALSKIQRAHDRDLADAREMVRRGLVDPVRLRELFTTIEPALLRYPAVDAEVLRSKVEDFLDEVRRD